jgi:hypothetical protein
VLLELERQDDDVFAWAERHVTFMPLEDEIQASATEILAKFPQLVNTRRSRSVADPFVIASDLWVQASLDYKQRLQELFFPEGIAYDGNRFNRTAATAPLFKYLAPSERADEKMVSRLGIEPRTRRLRAARWPNVSASPAARGAVSRPRAVWCMRC